MIKRKVLEMKETGLYKISKKLVAKLLTIAYKLEVLEFKFDEYRLQHWMYFLALTESPEMIFSQYKETCELLIDYPKIGDEDI